MDVWNRAIRGHRATILLGIAVSMSWWMSGCEATGRRDRENGPADMPSSGAASGKADVADESDDTTSMGGDSSSPATTGEPGSGGSSTTGRQEDNYTIWPNPAAPSNSHAWLREHHDDVAELRPRVLVLDVVQRPGLATVGETVDALVDAFAEMSRYHGYLDPASEPVLNYEIDRIVDLRDPLGAEYPDFWPPGPPFDVGRLFSEDFAPRLGYVRADGTYTPLCELFETGAVHELWIAADSNSRNIFESQSRVQVYDDSMNPVDGVFEECTNGCFYDPGDVIDCGVTVRMLEINKERGPGCGTHSVGHGWENLGRSLPYFAENARRFWGFDLERAGFPFSSLYACPYDPGDCVSFPNPESISAEELAPMTFELPWGFGCGNVHFAPNSRFHYDYANNDDFVMSSCESFAEGDAVNGEDRRTPYTYDLVEAYEQLHGDCGGGWITYMGQSFPGPGNRALDVQGRPMKNWWPFWFY